MAYLMGELQWGMGRGLGRPVHGAAQNCELILSRSSCSHVVAHQSARYADPLLHCFDALFAALVKQGSSSGAGDPHGLRYAAQDGPKGVQDAVPGGRHGTHVP
jgi:hypothetical protein